MTAKLFKAIRDCDIDELQQLIDKGASVNEADKKGITPLIECAIQGFEEGIVALLGAGAKSSAQDKKDGRTALIVAAIEAQEEVVSTLLSKDQSINSVINMQDTSGMTALHWALKLQNIEIANKLLSQSEIKLGTIAKDGYTPLMLAVQIGHDEIVDALLKRSGTKSTLTATDKSGNNILHICALLGHDNIFLSLLSLPALCPLINSPNTNGETPIHLAVSADNFNIVKELVERGADLKALTKDGLTPYQVTDPSSQSAKLIASKTGETPSEVEPILSEDEKPEIIPEKVDKDFAKDTKTVRKRKLPAQAVSGGRKGKQEEEPGSPLIARILLILIIGSSLTYFLSMFFK